MGFEVITDQWGHGCGSSLIRDGCLPLLSLSTKLFVGLSVCRSVCRSVGLSVGLSGSSLTSRCIAVITSIPDCVLGGMTSFLFINVVV